MQQKARRTHATPLSDDELILLDVIFYGFAPLRMLRKAVFADQWNYCSHNLDDDQLCETLDRLCQTGILASDSDVGPDGACLYYGLTSHGGALWEAERTPIWGRYLIDAECGCLSSGRRLLSICALSASIRDDYLQVGRDMALWSGDIARARRWQIANHVLIPWRSFPQIHVAVATLDDREDECMNTNWIHYEAKRTWWRDVMELQKFL
jgi:hypothetical protein